jgi:hypothetical protein
MSKFVDNMSQIHNNPFVLSPLILKFFEHAPPKSKNILLAYLILPLVLHEDSKEWLCKKARITSSIHTFKNKKENLFGLQERIYLYQDLTNKCIQHAVDNKLIRIEEDLIVDVVESNIKTTDNLKDSLKASGNLYKVFRDLDVVSIYRLLGVKKL